MSKDIGTLKEIGAQVGDVVGLIQWGPVWNENNDFARGKRYTVGDDRLYSGTGYFMIDDAHGGDKIWRIISRANQGPVREVTTVRKEIVPGVYGKVDVGKIDGQSGLVFIGIMQDWSKLNGVEKGSALMSLDDLNAAIDTLTAIRDAMADSRGDVSTVQAR